MQLEEKKCVPCEGTENPLTNSEEENYLKMISDWKLNREGEHSIKKDYKLKDFVDAISFVNRIAGVAESEGHHPNILIKYNLVNIELYTHSIGGLSENDFILAAKIDNEF